MTTEPLSPAQVDDLSEATMRILAAAMDRDADEAGRRIMYVAENYGDAGMYSVCNALAAVGAKLTYGDEEDLGAAVVTLDGSNPDDFPPGPARADLFAARFFAAFMNGDEGMKLALFSAPIVAGDDDQACRNVAALVNLAGSLARHRMEADRGDS